jgi:hypothetical protein
MQVPYINRTAALMKSTTIAEIPRSPRLVPLRSTSPFRLYYRPHFPSYAFLPTVATTRERAPRYAAAARGS